MTISLLDADVGRCFDYVQCYVAISRAVASVPAAAPDGRAALAAHTLRLAPTAAAE